MESGFRDYGFPVKTSSQVLSKGPDSLVEISSVLPPLLTVPAIGVTLVCRIPVRLNQAKVVPVATIRRKSSHRNALPSDLFN